MDAFIRYEHHDSEVWVREDLKGTHRRHCLCWSPCQLFRPGEVNNCPKAQKLYKLCVEEKMTTPVFECPDFQPPECVAE